MRKLIDRLRHRGDGTYSFYKTIHESQYWTQEEHQAYQLRKISELWAFATVHVPYYKKLAGSLQLHSISTWDDFRRIPVLTKDIIREHFDELQADNLPKDRFVKNSTSGSSGSNFYFYSDSRQLAVNNAYNILKFEFMGLNYHKARKLSVWGSSFDVSKATKSYRNKLNLWLKRLTVVSEYELSEKRIEELVCLIKTRRPDTFQSYPSIFEHIAKYIINHNIEDIHIPSLYSGGEKLFDYQRPLIEKAFHGRLYDFYGARDMPFMGMSCKHSDKIHVFQENVIFEVLDNDHTPISDGVGDIIVTNLHNYAMPFIRYQIGDQARVSSNHQPCACGRHYQIIDEIVGRKFEVITFPNGNAVGGTFWTFLLKASKGIKDFQVIQESIDSITINYVPDGMPMDDIKQKVIDTIKQKGGDTMKVSFVEMDKIPVTKAGKKQFVISKVNQK